ncbi:BTAD domain-containing putative transcriptional regulator [Salinispora oceanensis]|uniref:BTAD domain-containing putative transcriptional regulator n=1 Tax=Salinispora oceanensis TaxID=1050199 RepID=UPI0009B77CBE|nr:BTAD domain-containing putative transcriptional regulator [Salinispora oceanensis]
MPWKNRAHERRELTSAESVGLQVRTLRRRAGLTQQELADTARVSLGGLRDMEQDRVKHPRTATLRRLAGALGLSAGQTRDLIRLGQEGPLLARDLQIGVLGVLAVQVDGVSVDLTSEPQRIVLGSLAMSLRVPVGIDWLVDLIWGHRPPPKAANLVRTHVSRLRRRLQSTRSPARTSGVLVAASSGYLLAVEDDQLDLLAFQRLIDRGRQARDAGRLEAAFSVHQQAIDLWRGRPLEDLPALQGEPAVAALTRQHQAAVLEYADAAIALNRHGEVLSTLYRLTEENTLHEPAHARLMVALAGVGQQVEALQVFTRLRDTLAHDLGLEPTAELRDVHQAILRGGFDGLHHRTGVFAPVPLSRTPLPVEVGMPAQRYGFGG